jgi:tetratricopeptide (TPR) repeat protein
MESRIFISRFSPNRTAPEDLEKIHVQRHELLEKVVERVRASVLTDAKHHLLFVGPRGCGKTHLLALLNHRLQQPAQADLADRLRIAWLNEDETSTTFLELLLRIYRALSERYPQEFPAERMEAVYGKEVAAAQKIAESALLNGIGGRTVLVFIENLDSLFSQLDVMEQRSWRAFIQDNPRFVTIATAQGLFAGVADRDQPFFGFFDTEHLQPLTVPEATELMERIARLNNQPDLIEFLSTSRGRARVRAIHHLSGGNQRLHIVLSDFITRESLDDLVRPFEEMVDEQLTPYYQERLRWISPPQRKIVEFLCQLAHPVPVKVIAERLFSDHGTTTSQLKKLREFGYVTTNVRGREARYELAEPLMRLSMQVKANHDRKPLDLLVDFLRVWYEREDLERRLVQLLPSAYSRGYFETALAKSQSGEQSYCVELLRRELSDVDLQHCSDEQYETLRLVAEESDKPEDWQALVIACLNRKDYAGAVDHSNRLLEMTDLPIDVRATSLLRRGIAHFSLDQAEMAIVDSTQAFELPGLPAVLMGIALHLRGLMYEKVGRGETAIADYTRLIELSGVQVDIVAAALVRRGICWRRDKTESAMADFTRVIEMPDAPVDIIVGAFKERACIHVLKHRTQEAIADFIRAIGLGGTSQQRDARYARLGLVIALISNDQWRDALAMLQDDLIAKDAIDTFSGDLAAFFVQNVFHKITSREIWHERAGQSIEFFAKHDALTQLGEALVRHLTELGASPVGESGYDQWLEGWQAAAAGHAEFDLPLRLLRVGIAYLKTHDEGSLLELPKEEREILRQALQFDKPAPTQT